MGLLKTQRVQFIQLPEDDLFHSRNHRWARCEILEEDQDFKLGVFYMERGFVIRESQTELAKL